MKTNTDTSLIPNGTTVVARVPVLGHIRGQIMGHRVTRAGTVLYTVALADVPFTVPANRIVDRNATM